MNNPKTNPLGFLGSYVQLGLSGSDLLMSKFYPETNRFFRDVVAEVSEMSIKGSISEKLINSLYDGIYEFYLGRIDVFKDTVFFDDGLEFSQRKFYKEHFPRIFDSLIKKSEEFGDLKLIKALKVVKDEVILKNPGKLGKILQDEYKGE